MKSVAITINDKKVIVQEGKTILQAVREHHIDEIPTLCYDERLDPYGSCYLCVVEVEGVNKLLPSCSTLVADGMKITTNSKKIQEARKAALELLLSNHYADCIGACKDACPASVDIQEYIAYIREGNIREAVKTIKRNNPLPLICGRVCPHECEAACRRNLVDEAVAINPLKRYVADTDINDPWKPAVKIKNKDNIAIIGGGPSGLSCAYFLSLKGYPVTIYDKMPLLGGMLRYGIPEYRLPKKILDREIEWIIGHGIEERVNQEIGVTIPLEDLLHNGYAAAYIAIGAWKPARLGIEKEDSISGIIPGIDFLRNIHLKGTPELHGIVLVAGGGNTAIDAARTALRCGADTVKLVYRRSVKEMPAHHLEVEAAEKEGIEFLFLTNPKTLIEKNNKLTGIECMKMKLEQAGPGERPRPVPVAGSEFILQCDYLISAIGQKVDARYFNSEAGCELKKWGTISVKEETLETTRRGVFAGGDAVTGPLTAVNAIAQGRRAADSIDRYLKTGKTAGGKHLHSFYSFKHKLDEISENEYSHIKKEPRVTIPELKPEDRIKTFKEVEKGLSENEALREASRCLACGCDSTSECKLRAYAEQFHVDISRFRGEVRKYKKDERHPFIVLDPNKCINCGRCVRTCSEICGISALGFVYRGFKAIVKPSMEKSLCETNCISCGNCIDSCPTGAISEKHEKSIPGTLERSNHESLCHFCSLGCTVNYKKINNEIYYVSQTNYASVDSPNRGFRSPNRGFLCMKGRFGHRYLTDKQRLTSPMKRINNHLECTDIDEALSITEKRLKKIIHDYGPDAVAFFCSPVLSNEELYLLQKFARIGIGTNAISSLTHLLYGYELDSLDRSLGVTCSTATLDDMGQADVIVAVNTGKGPESMILELQIKQAMKHRASLIVIDSSESRLAKIADVWAHIKRGTNTALLNGICRSIIRSRKYSNVGAPGIERYEDFRKMIEPFTEDMVVETTGVHISTYRKLVDSFMQQTLKIVFIYNCGAWIDKSQHDLEAIGNLLLLTGRVRVNNGNGLILLREYANSQGLLDMGVTPSYLPGFVKHHERNEIDHISQLWKTDLEKIFKPFCLLEKMKAGMIKAILIFGEDPLRLNENRKYFSGCEFLLVHDLFLTDTAKKADIVLPAASYIEQNGTYTRCDLTLQKVNTIIDRKGTEKGFKLICELARRFTPGFRYGSEQDILEEIQDVNRFYHNCSPGTSWTTHLFQYGFTTDAKKPQFSIFDTVFKTMRPEKPSLLFSENYFRDTIKKRVLPL
jgi:formate dehydrogenase major subunit